MCYWTKKMGHRRNQNLETNENENITNQNLWDGAETVPRGKFILINVYLNKQVKSKPT